MIARNIPGKSGQVLRSELSSACAVIKDRAIDIHALSHDASHYLLNPKVIAVPKDIFEVSELFAKAEQLRIPITFRSGGTSLSGQAVGDGILVDTRSNFRKVEVKDGGVLVSMEPGVTVRSVNSRLLRHKKILGPDPASEIACTIGGVVANNSSGMTCGIHSNTYQTLRAMTFVLPSGTILDTSREDSDHVLKDKESRIYEGLLSLRDRIRANTESMARIKELYSLKNTMGYGLNSFVDFDRPVEILQHLIVGSEGTLAFVAEVTLETVPLHSYAATALLVFDNLHQATMALPSLVELGFAAIELMDASSLRVGQRDEKAPKFLKSIEIKEQAALLIELRHHDNKGLTEVIERVSKVIKTISLSEDFSFQTEVETRENLWHIRKGLYALVASNRESGTTALLEDIAVPVDKIFTMCQELKRMFTKYDYQDSVIFGHAKDGNIHFLVNEDFSDQSGIERYRAFTEEMVEIVLSFGGTLKAEHGTGRIMAPFVRRQYGDELFEVMREVKRLIDPNGILNPGVLITRTGGEHVENLKIPQRVEPEVDLCVECGYCEPSCPSKDLTLTPRQRIVLQRELQRLEQIGDQRTISKIRKDFTYDTLDTCAVDGMCQTACPLGINTGELVQNLRRKKVTKFENHVWYLLAGNWRLGQTIFSSGLNLAHALPKKFAKGSFSLIRSIVGENRFPKFMPDLPRGGSPRGELNSAEPEVFYFPSCTNSIFASDGEGTEAAFVELAQRARIQISTLNTINNLCCGTPWKSKGLPRGHKKMKQKLEETISVLGNETVPIVCDSSSCTEGLKTSMRAQEQIMNITEYVARNLLDKLEIKRKIESITLHPTCSDYRSGSIKSLMVIADRISENVVLPQDWSCCGFAGDRGLFHPELTASATKKEAESVGQNPTVAYASTNRTCEIALTRATHRNYRHILEILAEATR